MFLKTDGAGNLSFSSDLPTTSFTGATVETSIADSDLVLIYDDSATAVRKMTKANLVAGIGGTNTPYFLAYASANKNLSETTITKVDLNTEVYDSASNFDSTTNYRFTPTTAGYYYFFAQVAIVFGEQGTDTASNRAYIYKNGSQLAFNSNIGWANVHWIDYANGTTDYYELYARVDTVSNTGWAYTGSANKETYFGAYKLIT